VSSASLLDVTVGNYRRVLTDESGLLEIRRGRTTDQNGLSARVVLCARPVRVTLHFYVIRDGKFTSFIIIPVIYVYLSIEAF
jgi:hypothetical protein